MELQILKENRQRNAERGEYKIASGTPPDVNTKSTAERRPM
jgi:hypothetical protein